MEQTKVFYIQQNIGKAKYVVNYYDGTKKHGDGSPFFDVAIFSNKRNLNGFIAKLISLGHKEL